MSTRSSRRKSTKIEIESNENKSASLKVENHDNNAVDKMDEIKELLKKQKEELKEQMDSLKELFSKQSNEIKDLSKIQTKKIDDLEEKVNKFFIVVFCILVISITAFLFTSPQIFSINAPYSLSSIVKNDRHNVTNENKTLILVRLVDQVDTTTGLEGFADWFLNEMNKVGNNLPNKYQFAYSDAAELALFFTLPHARLEVHVETLWNSNKKEFLGAKQIFIIHMDYAEHSERRPVATLPRDVFYKYIYSIRYTHEGERYNEIESNKRCAELVVHGILDYCKEKQC